MFAFVTVQKLTTVCDDRSRMQWRVLLFCGAYLLSSAMQPQSVDRSVYNNEWIPSLFHLWHMCQYNALEHIRNYKFHLIVARHLLRGSFFIVWIKTCWLWKKKKNDAVATSLCALASTLQTNSMRPMPKAAAALAYRDVCLSMAAKFLGVASLESTNVNMGASVVATLATCPFFKQNKQFYGQNWFFCSVFESSSAVEPKQEARSTFFIFTKVSFKHWKKKKITRSHTKNSAC